jgi:hypothetical protein
MQRRSTGFNTALQGGGEINGGEGPDSGASMRRKQGGPGSAWRVARGGVGVTSHIPNPVICALRIQVIRCLSQNP